MPRSRPTRADLSRGQAPRAVPARRVLGMMSGTSADGVDMVCVRIAGRGESMRVRVLWHRHRRYPAGLRRRVLDAMAPADTTTQEIARLHADLGDWFGHAAQKAVQSSPARENPEFIGLAGQTVCHLPGRQGKTATLQLGEPARVAERTRLPVVADFRQSDVAAGGQGAPLVPWTDWVLLRDDHVGRAVQNIGGVANVTWIPPGARAEEVIAFDTGPGNMIIDALVSHMSGGRERMDRNGRHASRGRVIEPLLREWLSHPYFRCKPPKTTGRELFGLGFVKAWLPRLRQASRDPNDWIATATAFTARTIAQSCRRCLPGFPRRPQAGRKQPLEMLVCGGGTRNPVLMGALASGLPDVQVRALDHGGVTGQVKEAVSFAMLAAACRDGIPSNLPNATGARRPVALGRVVLPP